MFGWFRSSDDWGDVPKALGVQVDGRGLLRGFWGGVELLGSHATERETVDEDGRQVEYEYKVTRFYARFDPKLRLGLSIAADTALSRFIRWVSSNRDVEIGDPAFDKAFYVASREPDAARSLLNGAVATELVCARARHSNVTVNDEDLCVTEAGWVVAPATVASAFEVVGRSAAAILSSRRGLVLPWEVELRERWASALSALGLSFDPVRLDARGVIDGMFVTVEVDDGQTLATVVTVTAPASFARGLRVFRQEQGALSRWFRGQDIVVGVPSFDDAFVVKGEDEAEVRAVLSGDAAFRLAQLSHGGAVTIENNTLTVRSPKLETELVGAMVEACVGAATAMVARAPSGAYRR
jgi:hypothetical protein